jgi:hypothetical protein
MERLKVLSIAGKAGRMKFLIRVMVIVVLLAEVAAAQHVQPDPIVPPIAAKSEEVPTPAGTPGPQGAPDLLPESNQLPAEPPNLRLPSPSILKPAGSDSSQNPQALKQLSPEEREKNKIRLAEARVIAMRNPRVIELLNEANGALSDEAKREFMRAYYHTLCTRMRNLEPSLGQTITAFEGAEIRKLAIGRSPITIVSRDLLHRDRQRHARRSD